MTIYESGDVNFFFVHFEFIKFYFLFGVCSLFYGVILECVCYNLKQ